MFLESVTILDAMGYWPTPQASTCLLEGNKFWFYSLVFSILWGVVQYVDASNEGYKVGVKEIDEKASRETSSDLEAEAKLAFELERTAQFRKLKSQMVIDGFDIFSPGFITGWIRTSASFVGFSSVVSTVLSSKEIWDRLKE